MKIKKKHTKIVHLLLTRSCIKSARYLTQGRSALIFIQYVWVDLKKNQNGKNLSGHSALYPDVYE